MIMKILVDQEDLKYWYNTLRKLDHINVGSELAQQLVLIEIKLDTLLSEPVNEPDTPYISHEFTLKLITQEWENRQAILKILDTLMYHGMRCDSMLLKQAERVKANLVGEKC
jgi:hypothetical protein